MDLFLKILGLVFIVIAIMITFSLKKEVKNLDSPVLHRSITNRWTKRSKTSTIFMGLGCICVLIGLILSM
ncbi:hypothetical protein E1I69_20715 [Bacillus timonensis]|uniref:Uncharacterized protein n=1 Tax=Bacillus timonensis TaxID=1033734 RepID=A0A4S3PLG1_9BACI|nr:hypothetical protein [Bacillus timonensis]THE09875.1 hypothetical protein E1I69_20715 [Bacillus timonensis]